MDSNSEKLRKEFNKHLSDKNTINEDLLDDFDKDALSGFQDQEISAAELDDILKEVDFQIDEIASQKKVSVPIQNKSKLKWGKLAIAASLLLLVGVLGINWLTGQNDRLFHEYFNHISGEEFARGNDPNKELIEKATYAYEHAEFKKAVHTI